MLKNNNIMVLMYHGLVSFDKNVPKGEDTREVGAGFYDLNVQDFESHLQWLQDNEYNVIVDAKDAIADRDNVIITFDDGENSNYSLAFPLLKKFNIKAYFFIIPPRVGRPGYMGWDEIRELHAAGMIIGSHGLSHETLTNLLDTQIDEELRSSKKNIEINLGAAVVTAFSVPRGFCNMAIVNKAVEIGYQYIFISERPRFPAGQVFNRVAVKRNWSMDRFVMAMDGKMPFKERIAFNVRDLAKLILRERGYNMLRRIVIKIFD